MKFSVRKVRTKKELAAAFGIRRSVFVIEQNVEPGLEYDGKDAAAAHFLVFTGKKSMTPVGTGRLRFVSKKEEEFCMKCMLHGKQPELLQEEWKKCAGVPEKQKSIAKLERICVLKKWRGKGAGAALTRHMVSAAKKRKAKEIILHSQCVSVPFYESLGFKAKGPVFIDANIRHRIMFIEL